MKKIRRSPVVTGLLFLLAIMLLFAGSVGGTQAALQVYSENYYSKIEMENIGLKLYENGEIVSDRIYGKFAGSGFITDNQDGALILKELDGDPYFKTGRKYPFVINAENSGDIETYLRVTVYKYWVNVGEDEQFGPKGWFHGLSDSTIKITDDSFDPSTIHLGYGNEDYNSSAWIWDKASHTDERDIYYYVGILPSGEKTANLFDTLWIDPSMAKPPTVTTSTENGKTTTTYSYDYDGYGFIVEVRADAVQTHSASAAIRSAWGEVDDSVLSRMNVA